MAKVLSIISGKGGCGKSLLTAVLGQALAKEGHSVLVVDTDIFVRGLTILLRVFRSPKKGDSKITAADLFGVFHENSNAREPLPYETVEQLHIERFMDCDVLPSVRDVSEPLDYDDQNLCSENFCRSQVRKLLEVVTPKYDYVLLDNRAGVHSFVLAACESSDVIVAIAEDDDVGRQTNSNLVNHLKYKRHLKTIYTIINKTRRVRQYSDIKERMLQRHEFSVIGFIPFDIEVMDNFGSERFWGQIFETLYFRSLVDTWNILAKAEQLAEISPSRYSFAPALFMSKTAGRYSLIERIIRLYGILIFLFGAVAYLVQGFFESPFFPLKYAGAALLLGGFMILISGSAVRNFLLDALLLISARKQRQ